MASALEALRQDIENIYSYEDKSTKSYEKKYEFENNKVTIVFQRVWEGMAIRCGVDMLGSADIQMQTRDSTLENKMVEIIKEPTYRTFAGQFPIVGEINII